MAISRPFLLALLGVALVGATFLAVQNARESATDGTAAPVAQPTQPPAEQPKASEAAGQSVETALAAAFAGDQKVESGKFAIRLSAEDFQGAPELDGAFVEVSGAFQGQGATEVPKFDIDLNIAAAGREQQVGAVSLGERGFVTRGDRGYAVPDSVMAGLSDARRQISEYAGEPQPKLSVAGFDVGGWLTEPEVAGTERMDGVEVTHVEAKLDPSRFVEGIVALAGQGSGIPESAFLDQAAPNRAQLERVLGKPEVDVYVGEDRILRRLTVAADLNLAAAGALAGDARGGKVVLDVQLSEVNQPQQIAAPRSSSSDSLQSAFGRSQTLNASGMMALGALTIQQPGLAGARADRFSFAEIAGQSVESGNPRKAARAVKASRKVVIFFRNPRGLDDRAVAQAVRGVRQSTEAVVLTDVVAAVDGYGKLVEDLGVSQTPSVVLIDSTGNARLIEGFIDPQSLLQAVADAR